MSAAFFAELATLLDDLTALGGCGVRWKDADLELRAATPSRLRAHEIPCCRAAQRSAAGRLACRADCLMDAAWWRRRGGRPLDRRCHRGVLERLVPVQGEDGLLGAVHVGPFRDQRSPDLPAITRLPPWDAVLAQRVAALGSQGLRLLVPQRELALLGLATGGGHELTLALHRIRDRARIDLDLDELAQTTGWRRERLARRLRSATGRTFSQLRAEAVTARARRLLAEELPLAGIATALGYRHHTHFSQAFRRATGTTPSAWRLAAREEPA